MAKKSEGSVALPLPPRHFPQGWMNQHTCYRDVFSNLGESPDSGLHEPVLTSALGSKAKNRENA
jgi:hypothetical protein